MIPESTGAHDASPWQRLLAEAIRDPGELLAAVGLPAAAAGAAADAAAARRAFPLLVPRGFVARMRRGDASDPLLRQVLATAVEATPVAGYTPDPLAEGAATVTPGLLRKYRGRALLVTTGACPVHCRYCFRRHFPYATGAATGAQLDAALAVLARDPSIEEVILSGGDPLSLSDRRLEALVERLEAIPQLRRLRLHTRWPVVLPERVDEALVRWLGGGRLKRVVVVHANHPREIDRAVVAALQRLREAVGTVLNQSVLLAGVNDDAATLAALSETLFDAGVLPYYLHLLDPVAGAAHFAVPVETARGLWRELAARLPGYLVPRLVREVAGGPFKVPL